MIGPKSLDNLAQELLRLPGVGPKTAQRLAFHLLKRPKAEAEALAQAIVNLKEKVIHCSVCCGITEQDPCPICRNPERNPALICVVEEPNDLFALEKSGEFRGKYHVLMGALSPLDGIGPQDLRIDPLLNRLRSGGVEEVIIATNPNMEGEATALYLAKLIKPLGIKVTRIARGLPMGGDLAYADEVTLAKSLQGRREI
ncbi:MAG TPA: recombination mediator RecR [bacterium]|nr:recombination mediator RecR [bacterium]